MGNSDELMKEKWIERKWPSGVVKCLIKSQSNGGLAPRKKWNLKPVVKSRFQLQLLKRHRKRPKTSKAKPEPKQEEKGAAAQ